MTPAEEFKLVAQILKTAKPFSSERRWLQDMITEYRGEFKGDKLRPYLEGLLAFALQDQQDRQEFEQGVDRLWNELFGEVA